MSTSSAFVRKMGVGRSPVRVRDLLDVRGNVWEPMSDWFFGVSTVDYDWSDVNDSTKAQKWTFSADANMVAGASVDPNTHHLTIEGVSGDADGLSNLREAHVIPETGNWGVAHIQGEFYGGPKFLTGGTLDEGGLIIKPQHGLCLGAQEDTKRRMILAWHDIAIGLPQSINLGVWSGNLDGSGFLNRQINLAMDLDESYAISANSQATDDDAGLVFDNANGNWSTPDDASIDITGDFSAKFDISPISWTPVLHLSIWSKYITTGNQRSYRWRLTNLGEIEINVSTDGTSGTVKSLKTDAAGTAVLAALAGGTRKTIVIDYDANNGASQTAASFYVGDSWNGPFTQLGATVTVAGATTAFSGTAIGEIGAVAGGTTDRFNGRIHQLEIKPARWDPDGNSATASVVDVRGQRIGNGVSSFVGNDGKTWTKSGTSTVVNDTLPRGNATIGAHTLIVGDRVNVINGGEYSVTNVTRVNGKDCSCTLPGGHTVETGSRVRLLFSSDASLDGTFDVTVSGNTMSWTDAGTNMSGHTSLAWDNTYDRQTALITNVTGTTIEYETFGKSRTITLGSQSSVIREFPYTVELKRSGTVAMVRAWGRHQSKPDWLDPNRALICDLTKPARSWNVTQVERTANVATIQIGSHDLIVGDRVTTANIVAATGFNATKFVVTAVTNTTFSFDNVGSDVAPTAAAAGTATALGSGTAQDVIDNPCPTGTGRIAFVNAHLGTSDLSKNVYGPVYGDTSFSTLITDMGQAVELETAQPITKPQIFVAMGQAVETETATAATSVKLKAAGQALETETATTALVRKTVAQGQALEVETATATASLKLKAATQALETETATATTRIKSRALAQATETEQAQAVARLDWIGQATELETAQPILRVKTKAFAQAVETETATTDTRLKTRALAQLTELETATATARLKLKAMPQATELESASTINILGKMTQVVELETANAFTRLKVRTLGQLVETETATATVKVKLRTVAQVLETETAGTIVIQGKITQALEIETASVITARKLKAIGQPVELETARAITKVILGVLGQVTEVESAFALAKLKRYTMAAVLEAEQGLTIVNFITDPTKPPNVAGSSGTKARAATRSPHGARTRVRTGKVRVI